MGKIFIGNSLDDLLYKIYPYLLKHGEKITPGRGECRECINAVLKLKNPLARLSGTDNRGSVLFSCLGETLWYFSGSNELAFIEYYIPNYRKFIRANKKQIYALGAYGPRLFGESSGKGKQLNLFEKARTDSQIRRIIDRLKAKETTRQAVVQIFNEKDIEADKNDVPYTCIMQFFVRKGNLTMIVYMRSNDAYRGVPHDIFAFTFLQEYIARSIGVNLGTYAHQVGSLHIYEKDIEKVKKFCKELRGDVLLMPFMPAEDPYDRVQWLLGVERSLREEGASPVLLEELPPYWEDIARLLSVHYDMRDKKEEKFIREEERMHSAIYISLF